MSNSDEDHVGYICAWIFILVGLFILFFFWSVRLIIFVIEFILGLGMSVSWEVSLLCLFMIACGCVMLLFFKFWVFAKKETAKVGK